MAPRAGRGVGPAERAREAGSLSRREDALPTRETGGVSPGKEDRLPVVSPEKEDRLSAVSPGKEAPRSPGKEVKGATTREVNSVPTRGRGSRPSLERSVLFPWGKASTEAASFEAFPGFSPAKEHPFSPR